MHPVQETSLLIPAATKIRSKKSSSQLTLRAVSPRCARSRRGVTSRVIWCKAPSQCEGSLTLNHSGSFDAEADFDVSITKLTLASKPERTPDERMEKQSRSGTNSTTGRGVSNDTDDALGATVRSRAVRERHHGKPEQSTKRGADRQPSEEGRSHVTDTFHQAHSLE